MVTRTARARIKLRPPNPWRVKAPDIMDSWREDVKRNLSPHRGNLSAADLCSFTRSFYARFDETCPDPIYSDCSRGCSICCRRYIDVIVPEVLVVYNEVQKLPAEDREVLEARVRVADETTRGMDSGAYFSGHHDCVCVGSEGQCLVYVGRPLACRWVHAVSREDCHRNDGNPDAMQDFDARTSELGKASHTGFAKGLADFGYDMRMVALHSALRMAIDDPTLFDRWAEGEDVFAPAEAVY